MLFDAAQWIVFFNASIVTFVSLAIQTLAIVRIPGEWYDWYEHDIEPVFSMTRTSHGGMHGIMLAASSIGFYFLLRDENGAPELVNASWSSAVFAYLIFTVLDGTYLIPLWHWQRLGITLYLLGATILVGALYLILAAFGSTNPGLVTLPVAPRLVWLCFVMGYDGMFLRRQKGNVAAHKSDDVGVLPQFVKKAISPSNTSAHSSRGNETVISAKDLPQKYSQRSQSPPRQQYTQQRGAPNGWNRMPGPAGVELAVNTQFWRYKPGDSTRILCWTGGGNQLEVSGLSLL